jgi:replicative DNA helicase
MEYDIAKNRKGPTGSVPLRFIKNWSIFTEAQPISGGTNEKKSFN